MPKKNTEVVSTSAKKALKSTTKSVPVKVAVESAKPTDEGKAKRGYTRHPDVVEPVKKALADKKPHSFGEIMQATKSSDNSVRKALNKLRADNTVIAEGPSAKAMTYRLAA
jgi:hypothetical protein